ncbi:MAG: 4-hydroxythreonine-4-phosphate dehydrogenase PdxA [Mariprofundus sp.]|nr:4-hydroxythreonine-4-phosphate dehydrogenase PdxA [Mariprofundus sp.]
MTVIVITAGEPAGIGPDCILRAYADCPEDFKASVIAAPSRWLQQRADQMHMTVPIREFCQLADAAEAVSLAPEEALYCWNPIAGGGEAVVAGTPSEQTASEVVGCIEAAAKACLANEAAALVTGPIEKAVLRRTGFNFPGHTEFLDYLAMTSETARADKKSNFVMMLASEHVRVALLTTHMAIRDVPDALSIEETLKCLRIVDLDLRNQFGIKEPRLALCGLNPHAGEQGHFGREEIDILSPAAMQAQSEGIDVVGPLPADTIFSASVRQHYDAIVCCYHDQGLIPLKALSFGEAVNVTLGLPFIRTSVDHGTALDRVGADDVSCSSLQAAMAMACQMCEASARPSR